MRDIKRSNRNLKPKQDIDIKAEAFANKASSTNPHDNQDVEVNLDPSAPRNAGKLSMPLNAFEQRLLSNLKKETGMSMNTIVRQAIKAYADKNNITV